VLERRVEKKLHSNCEHVNLTFQRASIYVLGYIAFMKMPPSWPRVHPRFPFNAFKSHSSHSPIRFVPSPRPPDFSYLCNLRHKLGDIHLFTEAALVRQNAFSEPCNSDSGLASRWCSLNIRYFPPTPPHVPKKRRPPRLFVWLQTSDDKSKP